MSKIQIASWPLAVVAACAVILTPTLLADEPAGGCEPAWHPFTSGGQIGVNNTMYALTVWNGDLIIGGSFTTAGGQTVNRIARWDGPPGNESWHPFTSGEQIGVSSTVRALTVWNGDLIAGGLFTTAGGQTVNRIARWDGSAWHPFISGGQIGVDGGSVVAQTVWNGDLVAGGGFTTAGGQTANRIVRWSDCSDDPECPGDLTGNGSVGVPDLLALLACWGPMIPGAGCEAADLTASGNVGVPDLLMLLANWGPCPQ